MAVNETDVADYNSTDNQVGGYSPNAPIHFTIASVIAIALCLIGIVGNVLVFCYLSFRTQRNKYTIYIIHLAVADVIFLIFSAMTMMIFINSLVGNKPSFPGKDRLFLFIEIFYDASQYSAMFFLTAISMERCVSVICPTWHQCYRPKKLSSIMCFFLWIVGCSESLIENFACPPEDFLSQTKTCTGIQLMTFLIAIGICLPTMVISSVTLLITLQRKFRKEISQELYIFIIVAVIIFVLSVIPFNFVWFLMYFQLLSLDVQYVSLFYASVYSTVLNSTINPYIYFIAETKWQKKGLHDGCIQRESGEKIKSHNNTHTTSCQSHN